MNKTTFALAGAGLGALTMFLMDPRQGRGRRLRLGEAASHISHRTQTIAEMTVRDVRHRLSGTAARTVGRLVEAEAPGNELLVARVRARLGRLVSHPGAIDVSASNGTITLTGQIFEAEVEQLIQGVSAVPGVSAVQNSLESHRDAAQVPALQGAGPRTVQAAGTKWLRWTPTARLIAGVTGVVLVAVSSPKRPLRGAAAGITGMELIERALMGARRSA